MHARQQVDISVDAYKGKLHGYGLGGEPASTRKCYRQFCESGPEAPVRICLNKGADPEYRLRPGMSVEPKVWLH
jgi:hypothetical protein